MVLLMDDHNQNPKSDGDATGLEKVKGDAIIRHTVCGNYVFLSTLRMRHGRLNISQLYCRSCGVRITEKDIEPINEKAKKWMAFWEITLKEHSEEKAEETAKENDDF
jgi:hypothetical protein